MALVLGGAALHLVAAYAAGAGAQEPIGIVAGGGAIKSVVAGAARAEVAVGLVIEAVVVAALFHGEHGGAVGAGSLAVFNGGGGLVDGGAGCIIVLRSQDSLGILIVDDHLIAGFGETGGGLVGVDHQVELLGEEGFVIPYIIVAAPIALVRVPLDVVIADGILNIEAVLGGGEGDLPALVDLVQGRAGKFCAHGQLLTIGGGEGVGAVVVYAESPFIGGGKALELAVGQGHIGAFVVEAVVLCGQSFPIGGVEYHYGVAVLEGGQVCDDAALAGGRNLQTIDAGKQHSRVGSGGVIHEPGAIDIV